MPNERKVMSAVTMSCALLPDGKKDGTPTTSTLRASSTSSKYQHESLYGSTSNLTIGPGKPSSTSARDTSIGAAAADAAVEAGSCKD
eukprot:CAMPEP_0119395762 /NCGR_PEP_ID=MMETSP1334-20130426/134464_1 /TAXON_ID=127549 /ORGANISM="Calcidiscus leptoporus, Strain RCC1130" /LENGTH=86 /DNA_ID=CAMNT_0007419295 /DNA_START=53 /DNA_END=310 /DNA_ORIENTATION=-